MAPSMYRLVSYKPHFHKESATGLDFLSWKEGPNSSRKEVKPKKGRGITIPGHYPQITAEVCSLADMRFLLPTGPETVQNQHSYY